MQWIVLLYKVRGVEIEMKPPLTATGNEFKLVIKAWIPNIIQLLGDQNRTIRETATDMIRRFEVEGY
jgi:hypothetical protein